MWSHPQDAGRWAAGAGDGWGWGGGGGGGELSLGLASRRATASRRGSCIAINLNSVRS